MTTDDWIVESLGRDEVAGVVEDASRRRLRRSLDSTLRPRRSDEQLGFVAGGLELRVIELLDDDSVQALRFAAQEAFQVLRTLPPPVEPVARARHLVRLGCLGVLGDRGADVRRLLIEQEWPDLPSDATDWGDRVHAATLELWLRLFRKSGWEDLDAVHHGVARLRQEQASHEPALLRRAEAAKDVRPAFELITHYHLAKAAELVGTYLGQGHVDKRFDITQQLEAQFDRAVAAASRSQNVEVEMLARILARTARALVDNSIWTVTRAVNSRVTGFVESLVSRSRPRPFFEMLPPQRRTLRECGLLGSSRRSVIVSLPTSSGKTMIAQFRILQALNQFDREAGWVAYLAPTRALVNQITVRLRRDFAPLGVVVEKVSPALEVDGLEADMLGEEDQERQFRVLVTTPEKLDLMLRGGWEAEIGRPLTLVVVDEAHGLAASARGLRLELLLATLNRECQYAQFLLLTPFVRNAAEIASWLDPASNDDIELGLDWSPNDRVVGVVQPQRGQKRGEFSLSFEAKHTARPGIEVPEPLSLGTTRPLGLSWTAVSNSPGKLAAAAAQVLQRRGTVIVLTTQPRHTWGIAEALRTEENASPTDSPDRAHIQRFFREELGEDFPLNSLLEHGIAVHHAGLPDDVRTVVEWLTEQSQLSVLVATTTIAQGVNFPVSAVVFASHMYPYGVRMPPEDFWNIAGRAGRVDQGDLGVVALAACTEERAAEIETMLSQAVGDLNSTLLEMVQSAIRTGGVLELERLSHYPEWSSFLQYLAHTYRQMGDHDAFASQVEQVLRGTLGFQSLRKSHPGWANQLVQGVQRYAGRIRGKPLQLVDMTGFSWESVSHTLRRLSAAKVSADVWSPELFSSRRKDLGQLMGILLQVPELRQQLEGVLGGSRPDGDSLSRIVADWVRGRPLTDMAREYFATSTDGEDGEDSVAAMTRCCQSVFSRLTQTASWGLAALQSLTLRNALDEMAPMEQRAIRNLPARVYYGVNSDEAVALRLLGVPRTAAEPLAGRLKVSPSEALADTRAKLRAADTRTWIAALGDRGESYQRVWQIIEGER